MLRFLIKLPLRVLAFPVWLAVAVINTFGMFLVGLASWIFYLIAGVAIIAALGCVGFQLYTWQEVKMHFLCAAVFILMAKGVPEVEIAFIHDVNTEVKKTELFSKVKSGQVRFLLGSTAKMGAGLLNMDEKETVMEGEEEQDEEKEEKEEHQSLHDRITAIKQNSQRQEGKEAAMRTTEVCIG